MKRIALIFVVALPFIISIGFLAAVRAPALVSENALPNPNGYDGLVAAARMIQSPAYDYEKMSEAELAALAVSNALPLALERSAIMNACQVPIPDSGSYISYTTNHLNDVAYLKDLAQAITAQGRLAELENHPAEAAEDYLNVMQLGAKSSHGGANLDGLMGEAVEEIGRSHLEKLVAKLDAPACRLVVTNLMSLDALHEKWSSFAERQNIMHRRLDFMSYITVKVALHGQMSAANKKIERKFAEDQRGIRSLAIRFAARAFELDKGKSPASVADLVPGYLKEIPKDPVTGKDLTYPP